MSNEPKGTLVVIGGHEEKSGNPDILSRFVELSGGEEARLVVMTSASTKPERMGLEYEVLFTKLGARSAESVHSDECRGNPRRVLELLERATGVFFIGGQPYRILDAIKGTPIDDLLHKRYAEGLVLAGTSAGALMMPEVVITDGESKTHPTDNTIESAPGMGFLRGVVVDVHFAERGRCGRMLSALARFPDCLGLGIDEDAALVIHRGECEVLGGGSVFFFDPGGPDFRDFSPTDRPEIALAGVRLHVLPSGYHFNLSTRTPQAPSTAVDAPTG